MPGIHVMPGSESRDHSLCSWLGTRKETQKQREGKIPYPPIELTALFTNTKEYTPARKV